jgi:nitrous-oxide reductase
MKYTQILAVSTIALVVATSGCKPKQVERVAKGDAAQKVYVAPGDKDEIYLFTSGGFSGQMGVYGLPSGRWLRQIPVFSQWAETGYGYTEETTPMLMTSHGFIPWDDSHHPELSKTNGEDDGRWIFINGNNTPRIARLDLATFRTVEIIELPNAAGNHASPFCTENTEYVVGNTRFSVPLNGAPDVPNSSYKENFKGAASFVKVNPETGEMTLDFQLILPGFNYDLAHAGKNASHDWMFFTTYNSEQAHTLLEVNASQADKDFVLAVNWVKMAELAKTKGKKMPARYYHNVYNEKTHSATATEMKEVLTIDAADAPGLVYYMPCPKSPHGVDVDPTGEYIAGGGKLATVIPVYSYTKMMKAIEDKAIEGEVAGIPVLKYEAVIAGEVEKPGLGPLHTEFDDKGFAYTSMFVSSEIVKWEVATQQVVDRIPTYYSIGHLCVPGGDSKKPFGKYVIALNKITKDRYLPTGPELTQSAQLYDITGDKMELLLDFPTVGEPHYAQAIPADKVIPRQVKIYKLDENEHPYAAKGEKETKVWREGNKVHVNMTMIRSHFSPDNIEGVQVGDEVYFHLTNLEQDWDIPHGFAVIGAQTSEILVMPGETMTYKWVPKKAGNFPFYCTDFCSALHQEMQGYIRVSPKGSTVPISGTLNGK